MKLKDLLYPYEYQASLKVQENEILNREVKGIEEDSRKICKDYIFFAFKGENFHGLNFADSVLENGALAIITDEKDYWRENQNLPLIYTPRIYELSKEISYKFYIKKQKSKIIGITGTNGKTTTSHLLSFSLRILGYKTGVIGTNGIYIGGKFIESPLTTPRPIFLHKMIGLMEAEEVEYIFMEVSSHALELGRVDKLEFSDAIFTNLTQDHLDFHGSMEEYYRAKRKLFDMNQGIAYVNIDDLWGQKLIDDIKTQVVTYGIEQEIADVRAQNINTDLYETTFELVYKKASYQVKSKLLGKFNVYNYLAAVSFLLSQQEKLKVGAKDIIDVMGKFEPVAGRFQKLPYLKKNALIVIDYAHTPDGLENIIKAVRHLPHNRIITLFGCGGNRDRGKRPQMAKIAEEFSDFVIVTSDNPRSEDPEKIILEVETGFKSEKNRISIIDRREAIEYGVQMLGEGDILILAGKGHETYQILKDRVIPFSDYEVAREAMEKS